MESVFSDSIEDDDNIIHIVGDNCQDCDNEDSINLDSWVEHHPNSVSSHCDTYIKKQDETYIHCQDGWRDSFSNFFESKHHIDHHQNHSYNESLHCGSLHVRSYTRTNNGLRNNFICGTNNLIREQEFFYIL